VSQLEDTVQETQLLLTNDAFIPTQYAVALLTP